ncbi:MAG: serine/threonine protein kinase/tetratricopeptide (TPR) repeat protein [Planctomycetota bacterium]|jgi:serine/threonine protein kinase/tetratricopeptide (TPR) repeat protein
MAQSELRNNAAAEDHDMTKDHDRALDDEGLTLANCEDSAQDESPSVIERIGEITGSRPRVLLRADRTGETPVLKALAPDECVEAGKYVVHGEIGHGGVGTVHRGHDQDLGRDVAMKFLHDKYKDDPAILIRFVEEAQIGGQLQHPGIVPVYDLGMMDGMPFFSMKLVKGQTLAKKLAERASTASERLTFLSIFEDVCQTLAYAHTRGVVHRDLKPANIMIGSFGEVQVVDWGMGKVMQAGGVADEKLVAEQQAGISVIKTVRTGDQSTQSTMGSMMGTLAYMPPEQARGDVEAMDERSDVFALGAILCEILTGLPPYVGEQDELAEMAAMAKLDDAYARLEECGAEDEMVELATRCLIPAPAARPKSAEVVALAVHDHLAAVESRVHKARIEAAEAKLRTASLKRTQKFGIGLTLVIAAGLFISLWFWRAADSAAKNETLAREAAVASAENERVARAGAVASATEALLNEQQAVVQTEIAQRELARAVEIKTLITDMLQSVTPEQARGADTTLLKSILDSASRRLNDGAITDELVAAELHAVTGKVFRSIGLYQEAEAHLPIALEIMNRVLGTEHPDTLASMGNLANLYQEQGRYAETEALHLQTLEFQKRVLGEEHPNTLLTMGNLATLYRNQGRSAEAEALFLQTLEIEKRVLGEEDRGTLGVMNSLGNLYIDQGRYEEAEALHLETLEIQKRTLGEEDPSTLHSMGNLAALYQTLGRNSESETLSLQTQEIMKRVLGEDHPDTLSSMGNLAILYAAQGRNAEAEPLYLQTLKIMRRVLGEEHPDTLGATTNLAFLYIQMMRFEDAAEMFEISLPIKRRVLGLRHPWTGYAMSGLAIAYVEMGRNDDALPLQRELLSLQLEQADDVDASAEVLNGAAWTLLTNENESLRDPERALGYATRADALVEEEGREQNVALLDTLALAQHRTGDTTAAIKTLKRAIDLMPEGADPEMAQRLAEYESALRK